MTDTEGKKPSRGYVSPYLEYTPRTLDQAEHGLEPKRDVLVSGDRQQAPQGQTSALRKDQKFR